jgi:type IV pilus assembly protein PilC
MATFAYTARDNAGAAVSGTLAAGSVEEVMRALRAEGKFPTAIHEGSSAVPSAAAGGSGRGLKVPRADIILLATQLAVMLETGVTLAEALECVGAQCDKPVLKRLIDDIAEQVQRGADFSTALARHSRSFPRLFVTLIRASEKSGLMAKLLLRGTEYLKSEQETLRRVKGALVYPAIMFVFAVATTIFLLAFVLPKFTSIYAAKAAALPLPTKLLMGLSDFVIGHWLGLIVGLVGAFVLGSAYVRTRSGSRVMDYLELRVPVLGPMFRKLHLARSMRMVGTMASAGVPLIDCVAIAQDLSTNSYFRELWSAVSEQLHRGKQLSQPLFLSPLVPRSVAQMIHSGEKGGKLAFVLEQVSGYAEQELKDKIAELTRYIEPAMIVVMGVIIGGVALALLLPVFTISRVMAK